MLDIEKLFEPVSDPESVMNEQNESDSNNQIGILSEKGIALYFQKKKVYYLKKYAYPLSLSFEDIFYFHFLTLKYLNNHMQLLKNNKDYITKKNIEKILKLKPDTVGKLIKKLIDNKLIKEYCSKKTKNQKAYMVNPLFALYSGGIRIDVYEEFKNLLCDKIPVTHRKAIEKFLLNDKKGVIELKKISYIKKESNIIDANNSQSKLNETNETEETKVNLKEFDGKEEISGIFKGKDDKVKYCIFYANPVIAYPNADIYDSLQNISPAYIGMFHILCRYHLNNAKNQLTRHYIIVKENGIYDAPLKAILKKNYINCLFDFLLNNSDKGVIPSQDIINKVNDLLKENSNNVTSKRADFFKYIKNLNFCHEYKIEFDKIIEGKIEKSNVIPSIFIVNPYYCYYKTKNDIIAYETCKFYEDSFKDDSKQKERIKNYESYKNLAYHPKKNDNLEDILY